MANGTFSTLNPKLSHTVTVLFLFLDSTVVRGYGWGTGGVRMGHGWGDSGTACSSNMVGILMFACMKKI